MTSKELQTEFYKETGINAWNGDGEPDIDYVSWLEKKVKAYQRLDGTYAIAANDNNQTAVSNWIKFDRNEKSTWPDKYGTYFVCRKDGKVHWETWNNSGWAYNHNVIVYWAYIHVPLNLNK